MLVSLPEVKGIAEYCFYNFNKLNHHWSYIMLSHSPGLLSRVVRYINVVMAERTHPSLPLQHITKYPQLM